MIERMAQTVLLHPAPLLACITAPTLLVWGEQDGMITFGNSSVYLKAIKGAALVSLPGVGHLPHEEAPAQQSLQFVIFCFPAISTAFKTDPENRCQR